MSYSNNPIGKLKTYKACHNFDILVHMAEANDTQISTSREAVGNLPDPIGDIIIGDIDPRTLTKEAFLQSPDLLWHGSGAEFVYNPNFDVHNKPDEGVSNTVGYGFYATDSRDEAELFSSYRLKGENKPAIVIPLLPYQAKMFDFRANSNNGLNAPVPPNIIRDYIAYFRERLRKFSENAAPDSGVHKSIQNIWSEYLDRIRKFYDAKTPINLRNMLARAGSGRIEVFDDAASIFTDFMTSQGYDGAIYIEGGDDPRQKEPTSFVFYNLDKIGTYETWKQEELAGADERT